MTTNEKQNKQPEAGKKELTPRQIQMRKKLVVFPLFFLAFAGCMWLIFSPGERTGGAFGGFQHGAADPGIGGYPLGQA